MSKIIHAKSGHTLFVKPIKFDELPSVIQNDNYSKDFKKFWVVKNWDDEGVVFMYLGKGQSGAPKEICVWYAKGSFWSSYGLTMEDAINGAQADGWMYA